MEREDFAVARLSKEERAQYCRHQGMTLWLTGLSAAGKSAVGFTLEKLLLQQGYMAYALDGDILRQGLNQDLNFDPVARAENIRRVGEVAKLMNDSGVITIACLIAPYQKDRAWVRQRHQVENLSFIEVFIDTPLAVCEARDPKGLYKKARQGEITNFTGIDASYENPLQPEITIDTTVMDPVAAAGFIMNDLQQRGIFPND